MDRSKDAVARRLGEAHFAVEPGISRVVRLLTTPAREDDPQEPIKLLEVNENTTADGILPVFFGPRAASGVFYPSIIVEVTPEEYEQIRQNPARLPNGWILGDSIARPALAGAVSN